MSRRVCEGLSDFTPVPNPVAANSPGRAPPANCCQLRSGARALPAPPPRCGWVGFEFAQALLEGCVRLVERHPWREDVVVSQHCSDLVSTSNAIIDSRMPACVGFGRYTRKVSYVLPRTELPRGRPRCRLDAHPAGILDWVRVNRRPYHVCRRRGRDVCPLPLARVGCLCAYA